MNGIKLTAKLKAYSKAPYYTDFVRGVNELPDGQVQELQKDVLYGRRNGKWEKILDGSMLEINERLLALEKNDTVIEDQVSKISVDFDTVNDRLIYIDRLGQKHEWSVEVLVDNDTIRYNNDNKLELKCKQDDLTIKRVVDSNGNLVYRVYALEYDQEYLNEIGLLERRKQIISGTNIVDRLDRTDTNVDILRKELQDITSYVQGDSYQGTALDPVNLADIYAQQYPSEFDLNSAIQSYLNQEAMYQLEVTSLNKFPDNLKVLDNYRGDLWVFTTEDLLWKNNGSDLIVSATNDGVYGVVTGVKWDKGGYDDSWENDEGYLKGHILSQVVKDENGKTITTAPIFEMNGLKDRLKNLDGTKVEKINNINNPYDVVYIQEANTDGKTQGSNFVQHIDITDGYIQEQVVHKGLSIVKRTEQATIVTNDPTMDYEATNVSYINKKLELIQSGIKNFVNTVYEQSFISNDDDITLKNDYSTSVEKGY